MMEMHKQCPRELLQVLTIWADSILPCGECHARCSVAACPQGRTIISMAQTLIAAHQRSLGHKAEMEVRRVTA